MTTLEDAINTRRKAITTPKEIRLINDKPDSINIKQLASGKFTIEVKIYCNLKEEMDDAIKRLKEAKDKVEKMLNIEQPEGY